jgi:CubicO group peptidase (beta-lactamase class C family)
MSDLDREFAQAIEQGVFPGAVVLVRDGSSEAEVRAYGNSAIEPEPRPMREDTIFDLSSLTKPLATSVAVMLLVRDGMLRLDDRVSRFFHNFGVHGKTRVTFRHLLSHSSGLAAWRPYFESIRGFEQRGEKVNFLGSAGAKQFVYQEICRERPESAPGVQAVYSDLGFMLLGAAVETIGGKSLDRYCRDRIFEPMELRSTSFVDLTMVRTRRIEPLTEMIAATERCPWRKQVLCGVVHDDNAYAMGGVAGHAGLFGSARDIDRMLVRLRACWLGEDDFLPAAIVREFWRVDGTVPGSTWALGWDTPSATRSMAGVRFSKNTVGHLGFTGTSMWMDLERNRHIILLTNRVHPSRDNDAIREFRPMIHDRINEALGQTPVGQLR